MHALAKFMMMGGYAIYVWSAYAITVAVLIGNCWWSRYKRQQISNHLMSWFKRQ